METPASFLSVERAECFIKALHYCVCAARSCFNYLGENIISIALFIAVLQISISPHTQTVWPILMLLITERGIAVLPVTN